MKKNILFIWVTVIVFFSTHTAQGMLQEQPNTRVQIQELVHKDLITAIKNNDIYEIESLIASGIDIQYRTSDGQTALHKAIKELKTDIVILLLKYNPILLTDDSILSYAGDIAAIERLASLQSQGNPARAIIARNIVTIISIFNERHMTHQN